MKIYRLQIKGGDVLPKQNVSRMLLVSMLCLFDSVLGAFSGLLKTKPVNSSSTDPSFPGENCIDGNFSTQCVIATNDSPYFQVDLQEIYVVERVLVTRCENKRLEVTVGVSKDGGNFKQCGHGPTNNVSLTLEYPCRQAAAARYVKIWTERRTSFCMVEIDAVAFRVVMSDFKGLLKNKPVSSSGSAQGHPSTNCNDGNFQTVCVMNQTKRPYLLVDLQELYTVKAVFVTSSTDGWRASLEGRKIGTSKDGVTFTVCGRWPSNDLKGVSSGNPKWVTLEFLCSDPGPVRYVKIWYDLYGSFGFRQIDADGFRLPSTASSGIFRNKPVNSSSANPGYPVENCIDGIFSTQCVMAENDSPYFQLDLQELYVVVKVLVTSCENSSLEVTIGVSKDGSSFTTCAEDPMNNFFVTLEYQCRQVAAARYVKIWTERRTSFCMVEIDAVTFRVVMSDFKGILKNKPVSSSGTAPDYPSTHCNDGSFETFCMLSHTTNTFLLVDLQEMYIVKAIFVTSSTDAWRVSMGDRRIGTSKDGVTFTVCGHWPSNDLKGLSSENPKWVTLEFLCSDPGPVRYVKIWYDPYGSFGFRQIDADGFKALQIGPMMVKVMHRQSFRRVQKSTTVWAVSPTHCAVLCRVQLCRVFSFSTIHHPNCLLDHSGLTFEDKTWDSWSELEI